MKYSNDYFFNMLNDMGDKSYAEFSSRLIPGINNITGVRIPVLRKLARKIAADKPDEFLSLTYVDLFEYKMLRGFVIAYMKTDLDNLYSYLDDFIGTIDNWSLNDSLCITLKQFRNDRNKSWNYLSKYFNSVNEFENRFANVMLMSHFLTDEYVDMVLEVYSRFSHNGYYAKMGVAWGVASVYAEYPLKTEKFQKKWNADEETFNMTIRKLCESGRLSEKDKNLVKEIKKNKFH